MPAPAAPETRARIAAALAGFLSRNRLRKVHFAEEGRTPPPALAYAVGFPRLSLTLKGIDEVEVEQAGTPQTLELRAGEAVFVPAHGWSKPTWERRGCALHLLFGQKHLGISLVEHAGRRAEPPQVHKAGVPRTGRLPVGEILAALGVLAARDDRAPLDRTLVTALLQTALRLLADAPAAPGRKGRDTYDRVCLYVQAHFHLPLTRQSVAEQFRLHPNHLSRLFRKEGPGRFHEYLVGVRLERAMHLLKHGGAGLDELAASCGFHDPAYFRRVFQRRTNHTPAAYRLAAQAAGRGRP